MNANKPKLEQKDIGHGGMRAIGDVVGKHLFEMQQKVVEQQAEIEAGKIMIKGYSKIIDYQKAQIERMKLVEKLRLELIGDKFCEANCVWSDHHPDCPIGKV